MASYLQSRVWDKDITSIQTTVAPLCAAEARPLQGGGFLPVLIFGHFSEIFGHFSEIFGQLSQKNGLTCITLCLEILAKWCPGFRMSNSCFAVKKKSIAALKASRGQQADKGAKRFIAINPGNIAINLGNIAIFVSAEAVVIHDAHGRWRATGMCIVDGLYQIRK